MILSVTFGCTKAEKVQRVGGERTICQDLLLRYAADFFSMAPQRLPGSSEDSSVVRYESYPLGH